MTLKGNRRNVKIGDGMEHVQCRKR